jgi:PAS domain S-box-containing protein
MNVFTKLYRRLDLRGKITASLLAASLILGLLVTLLAYGIVSAYLTQQVQQELVARADVEKRGIEQRLRKLSEIAESLAQNWSAASGFGLNSTAQQIALSLLGAQTASTSDAYIAIIDKKGLPVATGKEALEDLGNHPAFARLIRLGTPQSVLRPISQGNHELLVMFPIRTHQDGPTEGAVVIGTLLASLLSTSSESDTHRIISNDGMLLAGSPPNTPAFQHSVGLEPTLPPDEFSLRLVISRDKARAMHLASALLIVMLIVGLLVIIGVMLFAHLGARRIAAPLGKMADAAEEIATSGRPDTRLPVNQGRDEFDRLALAFNTMVDRLSESYADLEQRVIERTREYEESQRDADTANSLLREAVSSITQGFTIYDENDRLVICNEAYLSFYETSRDLIKPGNTFEEIVRRGAERGQYEAAIGCVDTWVAKRVRQHQSANGEVIEQQLGDGRWLLIVEYRTPSGYIVGNRIDITALKNTEEALRKRELYLRATLDNLPFLFWLKDAEGHFLAVNQVFADACGKHDPMTVVGLTDLDVWPVDLANGYRADDRTVMESRHEKAVEEIVVSGNATEWIETYKKPVISADDAILGTVGFARNISDRKRIESALAESEQRWALAVEGTNDGIWDWNMLTGDVFFSSRWKSMLGYSADDLKGRVDEWQALIHPDDSAAVLDTLNSHLSKESGFYEAEFRMRTKQGDYRWILARGKATFDDAGRPIRMAGSHTDITERRAAEARIHDRTTQLNAIFDLSPDGFVSFDADRRVKFAAPAFHHMTGLAMDEISGMNEDEFMARLTALTINPERFPTHQQLLSKVGADGTAKDKIAGRHSIEMAPSAGGRTLEVGLREAMTETVSQILYFRDITHESEVDRMKSEFLSTAAHELRTPMANIYGFTELLMTQSFDEADRLDFLTTIYNQSTLMVSIINELLDLARIEARQGKDFKLESLDAMVLLQDVIASFKTPTDRNSPALTTDTAACPLRGDQNKLTQAIGNVLSNAYKYSPAGGPVEVSLTTEEEYIDIRITDQGIGMTPEQKSRVFERFYRADTSGKIPGTGLGMSIVKEIIELHYGSVSISTSLGQGCAITLRLPRTKMRTTTALAADAS